MNTKQTIFTRDYSLTGAQSKQAITHGLAEADWYQSPVPREEMKKLLERKNGPAALHTIIWFGLIFASAWAAWSLWGSLWCIIPFMLYGVLYASSSDSRWHEFSHGTAFKTDWLNNILYEVASFMVLRESTPWRWSHTRHHSDTNIIGRDPEVAVPRPAQLHNVVMAFFNLRAIPAYFSSIIQHSFGRLSEHERCYIPEQEHINVFFKARIYLAIYLSVAGLSIYLGSILPLLFIGLPNLYGAWMMPVYGLTQHAGLEENVLDHRLNCRTVHMNFINRFLYWNMNYHIEHHMYPQVPYHALPKLHALIKKDLPTPYKSIFEAYQEIIPAIFRQRKDPTYFVKRELPKSTLSQDELNAIDSRSIRSTEEADADGWLKICPVNELAVNDVLRFDHKHNTYAIYQTEKNNYFATQGMCSHGETHLSTGIIINGNQIECPKHNGRFAIEDGKPLRSPACVKLRSYKVKADEDFLWLDLSSHVDADQEKSYEFTVVSNNNVATFIKELVIEPVNLASDFDYQPGDYLQFDIPQYEDIKFSQFDIDSTYQENWKELGLFDLSTNNPASTRRNYSCSSSPSQGKQLRFNVRIAVPPEGSNVKPGIGSAYVFNLKPGDKVKTTSPYGDFHIKPTQKEMLYIGGGAGMAPLRSHISHLLETQDSARKINYWYGARSKQEIFYDDYFQSLEKAHPNFTFNIALSSPLDSDNWQSHKGFIHEAVLEYYLKNHPSPQSIEYYLCGPPAMIRACNDMLLSLGVRPSQIALDEF